MGSQNSQYQYEVSLHKKLIRNSDEIGWYKSEAAQKEKWYITGTSANIFVVCVSGRRMVGSRCDQQYRNI